jgi:hypothetical protein
VLLFYPHDLEKILKNISSIIEKKFNLSPDVSQEIVDTVIEALKEAVPALGSKLSGLSSIGGIAGKFKEKSGGLPKTPAGH